MKRNASKQGQRGVGGVIGASTGDLELGTKHLDSMTARIIPSSDWSVSVVKAQKQKQAGTEKS